MKIERLINRLSAAFDERHGNGSSEHERARFVHALSAISDFLKANEAPPHFQRQLYRLAIVLQDLNEGKTDPLLKPTPIDDERGANPGKVTIEWIARANAALGMVALIAGGDNRPEAARSAMRATGIDDTALLGWYDEFRKAPDKRRVGSSHACALFDGGRETLKGLAKDCAPHRYQAVATHFFKLAAKQFRKQGYRFSEGT